jgi:hypothetical protein
MKIRTATAALALTAVLAGCGGPAQPAKPAHSAATACRDFQDWYLDQGGNILAGKHSALLGSAVTEAPSGNLYEDMSTLQSDVGTASAAQGSSLGVGSKGLTISAAYNVEEDCESVNPSS